MLNRKGRIKKNFLKTNGTRKVEIVGIEGLVKFQVDRYKSGGDYFLSTKQFEHGLESREVHSWIELEIQEKSYAKVSECLTKITGTKVYSGNQISEKVKSYACQSTQNLIDSYSGLQLSLPFGATDIDLRYRDDAITYIQKIEAKNQAKQAELIQYLQKHKEEIM